MWQLQQSGWSISVWMAQLLIVMLETAQGAIAQVIPDNTTPTNVGACGAICTINGGDRNGSNLFHSFREFNVTDRQQVRFANPVGVANIFSRVTGSNPSNIRGVLGVDGNANLFLLNPNGILFGPNARLDVRGAFLATTADSFVFENGETFSAANPAVPLLTVNVPIGLQFGTRAPGSIANQGNLTVNSGQSLVLLGGDLTLNGGGLFVSYPEGGRIDLGAVSGEGTVGLEANGSILSLTFPDTIARADVRFTNRAVARAVANDSGSIAIHARNLDILGGSLIQAGIGPNQGTVNSQAGDITLNATGVIQISQASSVNNQVYSEGTGNSGAIRIAADSLFLTDGSQLVASTFGQGNAGNIFIDARDRISFDGEDSSGLVSTALSTVEAGGVGNGGNIRINTNSLSLTNGAQLVASTRNQGNAGNIFVDARDRISLDGTSLNGGIASSIFSSVEAGGRGNGGDIRINTNSLSLTNGAQLATSTRNQGNAGNIFIDARDRISLDGESRSGQISAALSAVEGRGEGNGGDIRINTNSLSLTNGAQLVASTRNQGNAGNIFVDARDRISLDGVSRNGQFASAALSTVEAGGVGNGGNIRINTNSLFLTNGAQLVTNTRNQGNAGNIFINARDRISFDGVSSDARFPSAALSNVSETGVGAGGNINFTTNILSLTNGARLSARTFGQGHAGNIRIAANSVSMDGASPNAEFLSGVFSNVERGGVGNGGSIALNTQTLSLTNGARLVASTFGEGNAGSVSIAAHDTIEISGASRNGDISGVFSTVGRTGVGTGGNIYLNTGSLSLNRGAQLVSSTFGQGDAGNIFINARDRISFDGEGSSGLVSAALSTVEAGGRGNGGNIRINTGSLSLTNGAQLVTSTRNQGNAGNIFIDARDCISLDGESRNGQFASAAFSTVEAGGVGTGGDIRINTNSLSLTNGARLFSSTRGNGDAGDIFINARDRISLDGESRSGRISAALSAVEGRGEGNGGDIRINTGSLSLTNGAQLVTSTFNQGNAGSIFIDARDRISLDGESRNGRFLSSIFSSVEASGVGIGGNIRINTSSLSLTRGAQLVTSTRNQGNAGNIFIDARDRISLDGESSSGRFLSSIFSSVEAGGVGTGGNIRINTNSLSLTDGAALVTSTRNQGNAGNIFINARDRISFDGTSRNRRFVSGASSRVLASGRGQGGNIQIATGQLSISNRARLASSSDGQGNAGNIRLAARIVRLDNNGTIDATNASRNGGNIALRDLDLLLLRRNSRISTAAGTANRGGGGNGGNIAIGADLILAVPGENSDINANAFDGRGGNIDITTQGIFGIEPRLVANPRTNDITASSTLGINGTISITTPDVDPRRGLTQLPITVVDAANQITQTCPNGRNTAHQMSEFVVTGRGGIPPNPADMLNGTAIISHLSSLDDEANQESREASRPSITPTAFVTESMIAANPPDPIQEAQGWVMDQNGKVSLVVASSTIAPHQLAFANAPCGSPQS